MELICFVPGCTNVYQLTRKEKSPSYYTFHRLPDDGKQLYQLLAALDLPESTHTDSKSVMCSAHFHPIIEHLHLVRSLLEGMIQEKASVMAVSSAPRCAASVAGCCVNLYSGVALFKFPPSGRRFDLWRMVAGSPTTQDCLLLCARHFKRNSFVDLNMEELIEGSIPVYPTRPLHPVHTNYRPLKKPIIRSGSPSISNVVDPYQFNDCATKKPKCDPKKKWRCAAVGCDVRYESHPDMRKINMPPDNDRLSLWREIVGDTHSTKYSCSLCTRHFGINQFYDGETRRNFVKMTNPVYPTGPLNLNTMDYCPPELDITQAMETDGDENLVVVTIDDDGQSETEIVEVVTDGKPTDVDTMARCSAVGCPVASRTHPTVKIFNFPYKTPNRINSWLRIAGKTCIQPLRLCARHFDIYKRELIPKYPSWDLDPETQTYKPIFDSANPRCCVPGCTAVDEDNVLYHRFPLDKQAFKVWVQRIGWKQLELYEKGDVFRGFRVCSQHFSRRWFLLNENGERVLRPGAIPTLFSTSDILKNPNEAEMSCEIDVVDTQNLEEESDVVLNTADDGERNLSAINTTKRKSSPQKTHISRPKKSKVVQESANVESASSTEDPNSELETFSNNSEVSFWIASPSASDDLIEETDSAKVEEILRTDEMMNSMVRVKTESLLSRCVSGSYDQVSIVSDAAETDQKPNLLFNQVDDQDGSSDGTQEGQDTNNVIEESETCELRAYPSSSLNEWRPDMQEGDLIDLASRLCNFSTTTTEKLRSLKGKEKTALNVLEELLVEHLEHVISITGVDFLKKCFDHVVNSSCKKVQKQPEDEPSEEAKKFAVCLQSLSGKGYNSFSRITNLPPSSAVREWLTNDTGYPGFNKQAFARLRNTVEQLDESVIFVSLSVTEMTIDKHVNWNGNDLFGYVDLGCGRIRDDLILEATSALMFHANGVTHDFTMPLGYCLIRDLSPKIRANLIHQYLLKLHNIGVRCNALVCDGSVMTYRTYKELGIFTEKTAPQCGFFKHPANKIDNVYCFIDIDDAMMSFKTCLAENAFFYNKYKFKVRWSDVEQLQDFVTWDLDSKLPSSTAVQSYSVDDLKILQVQLKNDSRPFKKNGALALKGMYQRYCGTAVKAEGTIEFLTKMESIFELFSGRNVFSKEAPAIRRSNTTVTLGSIKNHLIYLNSLADTNDVELLSGTRRIPILYLILNLVSLEGYLKRTFIYEKRKRASIVTTQSFTLRNMRKSIKQLVSATGNTLITASQFRDAYLYLFCENNSSRHKFKYHCSDVPLGRHEDPLSPIHIGLRVSDGFKYKHLRISHERFDDFIADNVIHSWLDSPGCPDCKSLVLDEVKKYDVGKISLTSDVIKMLKVAESYLSCRDKIPLNPATHEFHHFTNSVLNEMVCFSGFMLHEHLFSSVEFGRTSHFTIMVKDLLRIFLRYRLSFMPKQGKVVIKPRVRTTFNKKSWT